MILKLRWYSILSEKQLAWDEKNEIIMPFETKCTHWVVQDIRNAMPHA
jgi:hypothetical protein